MKFDLKNYFSYKMDLVLLTITIILLILALSLSIAQYTDVAVISSNNIDPILWPVFWEGKFSVMHKQGTIINYIHSILPENMILIIPASDGDNGLINDCRWRKVKSKFSNYKISVVGTLAQRRELANINYLYLPLDDDFFQFGVRHYFQDLIPWSDRSSKLFWRGIDSGPKNNGYSLRRRFAEKLKDHNVQIAKKDSKTRVPYTEFLKYKVFFIIDGAVIASNHMWAFATGCVVVMISNSKCWFSDLVKPWIHYVPISYDLSDLEENLTWIKEHDLEAELIANNALKFAGEYFSVDYQREYLRKSIIKLSLNNIK